MAEEKVTIEVPVKEESKPVVEEKVTVEQLKEGGFSKEEIAMAKDQGTIAEEEEDKSKEDKDSKDDDSKEEDSKEEDSKEDKEEKDQDSKEKKPEDKDKDDSDEGKADEKEPEEGTFEAEEKLVNGFNKNEKALYFKQKRERKNRQRAEEERDLLKVQNAGNKKRVEALEAKLKAKKDDIDSDLDDDDEEGKPKEEDLVTKADLDKRDADKKALEDEAQATRIRLAEDERDTKLNVEEYPAFDDVVDLARAVMNDDKTNHLAIKLGEAAANPQANAAEVAYAIGKLHPDYVKVVSKAKGDKKEDKTDSKKVEKIINNSKKKPSSASMGGGSGGTKTVAAEDMTVEDTDGISTADWDKLPKATRERLLKESC